MVDRGPLLTAVSFSAGPMVRSRFPPPASLCRGSLNLRRRRATPGLTSRVSGIIAIGLPRRPMLVWSRNAAIFAGSKGTVAQTCAVQRRSIVPASRRQGACASRRLSSRHHRPSACFTSRKQRDVLFSGEVWSAWPDDIALPRLRAAVCTPMVASSDPGAVRQALIIGPMS